ncbi:hypothetical protein HZY62_20820 [Maribacter polysiphoniae]|uniref:Uncharacterized protein n=1 Tax=Maribacter polysiphoniae TaxID=429344 RepID=A0A316EGC4_9FLAO|nr:hypothetical protein [Maribacter polysiphoniae]MBD1263047.1 hypothetical protein [Maribacter polysiphoniae]PWK22020.1 hypothetical protein LX92_03372 [Maribacter polysiphoniae]
MNLDLGSVIVGAIILIVCILPFILIGRSRKKREKHFLQSLSNIANQHNCQINQHEIFGTFAIGMDKVHNAVFFCRQFKDEMIEQYVDLTKIKNCKVINTGRTLKSKDGQKKVTDKLELGFSPSVKDKPEVKWEFFNADINFQPNGELLSMENWSKTINNRIKLIH